MEFGIANILKNGLIKALYFYFRRAKLLISNKDKSLVLGFNCYVKNTVVGHNNYIGPNSSISNCELGDHTYINANSIVQNAKMGKFCSIGPHVKIVIGSHPTNMISTHPAFYSNNKPFFTFSEGMHHKEYENVIIENDVWIGEEVLILGGVTIANGSIITARAVVTKDVEPYAIVGGIPAKLIKFRFDPHQIAFLLNFRWWDKSESWLRKNVDILRNPNNFFARYMQKD